MTIDLVLALPIKRHPAGTKGRGFIGTRRAVFVPAGYDEMYVLSPEYVRPAEPAPASASKDLRAAIRHTFLVTVGMYSSGCLRDPSAAYAAGLMDGAALVAGAVTVVWVCLSWARAVAASRAELRRMEARRDTAYAGRACLGRMVEESRS